MPITFNQLKTNLTSPELANYSINDQFAFRTEQLAQFKESPEYIFMDPFAKKEFERNVLSNDFVGYSPEELEAKGNIRAADYARQLQAVKQGSVVPLDSLDGFIDGFKNSLTGKVLVGVGNMVSQGTLSEHIYDDEIAEQLKTVRDDAFSNYEVEGITDYKISKGLGLVTGIASDIFATSKVYGAVAAPGLMTKPLWGKGLSKLLTKSSEYTAKQMATKLTPYWFGQMAIETTGFQIEEAMADYATGEMDRDGGFQSWLKTNFKSNLARGFGYFLAGEAIGSGIGSMAKLYGKTFTGKGSRDATIQQLRKLSTEDQTKYFINDIVSNNGVSENLLKAANAIDPELGKSLKKMERELKFAQNIEDPNNQFAYVFSRMFDADLQVEDDLLKLKSLKGVEVNKTFKNRNEFMNYLGPKDKEIRNQFFDASFQKYKGNTGGFELSFQAEGSVESINGSFSSVIKTFAPNDFRMRSDNIKSFVDQVKPKVAEDLDYQVVLKEDFFKNTPKPQKGIIYAPTVMDTKEKQSIFLKQFKAQMNANFGIKSLKDVDLKNYLENLGTYNKYSLDWMEQILGKGQAIKKGNQILVNTPDGQVKNFNSETEAGRYVHSLTIDETLLNKHLANEHGYRLKVEEDGSYSVLGQDRNKRVVVTNSDSIPSLLQSNPQFLPKKPIETSGLYLQFDNGEVSFRNRISKGSFKKVTDKLKEYGKVEEIWDKTKQVKSNNFTLNYRDATSQYNVKLINGLEKDFDDLASAQKWANQDWDNMKTRIEELEEFGWKVESTEAGYLVRDLQGNKHAIKDRDGLLEFMKNNQAIRQTDSLDGLGREYSTNVGKKLDEDYKTMQNEILGQGAQQKAKAARQFGWQEKLSELFEPIKKSVERYGYKEVDDLMTRYLGANRLFEQKDTQTKAWVSNIFKDFNTYEKETLGKIMMQEKAIDPTFLNQELVKYDLDPNNQKYSDVIEQARLFFDRMGIVAGVKTEDFIPNYLPRFLDVKLSDVINKDMTDAQMYNKYWSKDIPSNMEPFMRKMRKTDVARMQDVNLQQVMDSYAEIAWRAQYLEKFDSELGSQIDKLQSEQANDSLIYQLKTFKERMVGRSYDKDAVALAKAHEHNKRNAERIMSNKTLKKILSVQQQTELAGFARKSNPVSGAKALMTSALMSFKMRMPVRNMAQIWTHLGAIYDNPEILRAFKHASDNPEVLYKEMMEKGIVNPRQGRNSGQLMSFLRNTNQVGLNWHQNSDDFTRMIGYQAAKNRFSAAYNGLKTGKLDLEGFHKTAGSWALDDVDKLKISEYLQQGKLSEAETVLQSRIVEKCFFDYSSAAKPLAQNNAVANVFMQYSTFPLQTVQLWKNAFGNTLKSDPKQAMASIGRVSANIAGLSVLFSELIGYTNTPVSFLEYMMFTGGPAVGTAADAVSIVASNDDPISKGKRIIDAAKPTYTPFYGASRAMRKSIQSLVEGEEIMAIQYALGGSGKDQDSALDYFGL